MCNFWVTEFPCGCSTWRNSGYQYCADRGVEGKCTVTLKKYVWKTFCPRARKATKGKPWKPGTRLPPCCSGLTPQTLEKLCCKCDSSHTDPSQGPTLWSCPGHLNLLSEQVVDFETAESFFGNVVKLWPSGHQGRYHRRQKDKKAKGVWWSF
ncbi:hypothetical protein F4680DRAFT_467093 [Xylaria scruposa]|nr:hypothetical protein F4680DRAFT_467093 [Xylaria scruposa]